LRTVSWVNLPLRNGYEYNPLDELSTLKDEKVKDLPCAEVVISLREGESNGFDTD
jgi:hypothetical protein